MAQVAVAIPITGIFAVYRDDGIPARTGWVCDTVANRGDLVYQTAEGVCSRAAENIGATAQILGFLEQDVVADTSILLNWGYKAQQKTGSFAGDQVAIWGYGEFFVTAVSGAVTSGARVYPASSGRVSATQVSGSLPVGICKVGNTAANGPIVVEANLIGRLAGG